MFVGRHERQLDPKGRVALPSGHRAKFAANCYLAFGQDGCIDVLTADGFEEVANEMMTKVRSGEITKAQQRVLAASTIEAVFDNQGRLTIDASLREYAGIEPGNPVTVIGSFDRVEIWNPARYELQATAGGAAMLGHGNG